MFKTIGIVSLAAVIAMSITYGVVKTPLTKNQTSLVEYKYFNTDKTTPQYIAAPVNIQSTGVTKQIEVIELTTENSVVMDQEFNDGSVADVMRAFQVIAEKAKGDKKVVYLVLNSPGGSVDSGMALITFIKGLSNLDVKTISIFSASMSFQTAQNLGERLVLPNATVMSHRAKFGLQGEAPGEMITKLNFIMSMLDGLDQQAADRMGLTFEAYRALIADEYWVYGPKAVSEKAADRMVLAKCGKDLVGNKFILVNTMFGDFNVEVSKCPLIPGFVSITSANGEMTTKEQKNHLNKMFLDKKSFVQDFILKNNERLIK